MSESEDVVVSGDPYDIADKGKPIPPHGEHPGDSLPVVKPNRDNLWEVAYQQLVADDEPLIRKYELLLEKAIPDQTYAGLQQQIQAILALKRAQISQKQWKLQWGSRSIKVRTQVDRIVKLVMIFKDVGTTAVNADPVHAGLPWAGICLLMAPALNDSTQSEALMTGLDTISDIIARYRIVVDCWTIEIECREISSSSLRSCDSSWETDASHSHMRSDSEKPNRSRGAVVLDDNFRRLIIKLYSSILVYQAKAACYLNRNTMARLARNLPKLDDWTGMLENIRRLDHECREYKTVFDCAHRHPSLDSLLARFQSQEKILERLVSTSSRHEKMSLKMLSLISDIKVGQDHEDVRTRLGHKYWHSGQWLLCHKKYLKWRVTPSAVLWLQGPVGVGKTCLTSVVIQQSLSNAVNEKIAFFYCSQQQRESVDILRSLLAQLSLDENGDLAEPTVKWLRLQTGYASSSGRDLPPDFTLSMIRKVSSIECTDLLAETMNVHGSTTLIIDALDECHNPYEFLSCLESLLMKCPDTKVFVSSRFSIQKTSGFAHNFAITRFDSLSDLETFVDCEIDSPDRRARSGMTPAQATELRRILVSRAEGMFRWVELQIDVFLNKTFPIRHPIDVQTKLDRLQRNPLPISLKRIYDEIFVLNTQDQEHVQILAVKILQLLLCCFKPLSMEALVQAVALDENGSVDTVVDRAFVLQICSNFILVTQSDCAKFAHRSVKEYLLSSDMPGGKGLGSPLSKAHTQAAETCLVFLLSLENESIWSKLPANVHQYAKNLEFSSFEMYACFFWTSHCEMIDIVRPRGILKTFLDHILLPQNVRYKTGASKNGPPDPSCVSTAFQKWISLLWRVFHTSHALNGIIRQCLEDAISTPPNPIFAACIWGMTEHAGHLIVYDRRNIHAQNHRGKSPLFLACEYGHGALIDILAKNEVALHFQHPTWGTVLQAAAWAGDPTNFNVLLQKGAPVNAPSGCYGRLLDAAINGGNERIVMSTVRQRAEIWLPRDVQMIPAMGARPSGLPFRKNVTKKTRRDSADRHEATRIKTLVGQQYSAPHYLQELFPQGHKALINRLHRANVRRRQIMAYLELSSRRLPAESATSLVADDLCHEMGIVPSSGLGHSAEHELGSQVDFSVYTTFMVGLSPERCKHHPWPNFPSPSQTPHDIESSTCPCCFRSIDVAGLPNHVWRAHVMNDLRPYLCPLDNCDSNEKMLNFPWEFSQHMSKEHDWVLRRLDLICQLCGINPHTSGENYMAHLACHMEKIALLAIQPHDKDCQNIELGKRQELAEIPNHSGSSEEDEDSITGWSSDSSHNSALPSDDNDDEDE